MKFMAIIPARYASTRYPGKPLAILGGKTVIQRVYEQVRSVLDEVYVATDDDRIYQTVVGFGGKAVMTRSDHKSGTDRIEEAAEKINKAKADGKNIVAVGTTSVRTLETTMQKYGKILPVKDYSELFIFPPYKFKIVDKIITNFHLPKSTLLMLVSAFAGKDFIFSAYQHAIDSQYRFYSYGDCMLIL